MCPETRNRLVVSDPKNQPGLNTWSRTATTLVVFYDRARPTARVSLQLFYKCIISNDWYYSMFDSPGQQRQEIELGNKTSVEQWHTSVLLSGLSALLLRFLSFLISFPLESLSWNSDPSVRSKHPHSCLIVSISSVYLVMFESLLSLHGWRWLAGQHGGGCGGGVSVLVAADRGARLSYRRVEHRDTDRTL